MSNGIPVEMTRRARLTVVVFMLLFSVTPRLFGPSFATPGPPADSSAARPADLGLLEVQDLIDHPAAWVVLDARPQAIFREGHLPGARSFSWEDYTRTDEHGVPYKIWPPSELAQAFAAKGIDERTAVVVYGDADKSWGGEGWDCWALAWIGHQGPIRLLAGGVQAWNARGLPLEKGVESPPAQTATYHPQPRPEVYLGTAELKQHRETYSLIDVRALTEWLTGRIPGAVHISWDKLVNPDNHRPLTPEAMRALLQVNHVNPNRPVVFYCAGGIRSAYAWLAYELAALPPARNYEGGMEEWKRMK